MLRVARHLLNQRAKALFFAQTFPTGQAPDLFPRFRRLQPGKGGKSLARGITDSPLGAGRLKTISLISTVS
jgi:hypothetical protein